MSHDIRSPLSALKVLTQPGFELPAPQRKLLLGAIERIDHIANDLLQNTRSPTAQAGPAAGFNKPGQIPLSEIHSMIQKSINALAITKTNIREQIRCSLSLDEEVMVSIDRSLLERSFSNLIQNAVEAGTACPRITISTQIINDCLVIRIQDQGCGMGPDQLHQALTGNYSTKTNGNGLGLSGSRRMIEESGGRFEITSSRGAGTEVVLTFPILCRAFDRAFESLL